MHGNGVRVMERGAAARQTRVARCLGPTEAPPVVERERGPRGDPGEEADSGSGDSSFGDGPGDGGEMPHTLGTADSSVL